MYIYVTYFFLCWFLRRFTFTRDIIQTVWTKLKHTQTNKYKQITINITIFSQHQSINITEWEAQLLILCVSQWGASFWAGSVLIGLWLWLTSPFKSSQESFTLTSRNCDSWARQNIKKLIKVKFGFTCTIYNITMPLGLIMTWPLFNYYIQ